MVYPIPKRPLRYFGLTDWWKKKWGSKIFQGIFVPSLQIFLVSRKEAETTKKTPNS